MFKFDLPAPSAAEIRRFNQEQDAARMAIAIRGDLVGAIQRLHPFTLAVVARQPFPGLPYHQALAKFGLEISDRLRELVEHGETITEVQRADDAEFAPRLRAAAARLMKIHEELQLLDAEIADRERKAQAKRSTLEGVGVAGADLERLTAGDGTGDLIAQKASLQVESEAMTKFLRTRELSDLPPGFKVV